jgi:hypothetical protein
VIRLQLPITDLGMRKALLLEQQKNGKRSDAGSFAISPSTYAVHLQPFLDHHGIRGASGFNVEIYGRPILKDSSVAVNEIEVRDHNGNIVDLIQLEE